MTAAPPASVKIGRREVRIELLGSAQNPTPEDVLHTLCHWFQTTGDAGDPPACRIATGLARVLRNNPALAIWLAESFASQPQRGDFNGTKAKASA